MTECLIVIPAYCKSDRDISWLNQAVKSIELQTVSSWKAIVADSSGVPVEKHLILPRGVSYMHFDRRIPGDVANKVNGAAAGNPSRYITVMSHDDYLSPWFLERQLELMDHNQTLGFCQFHVAAFGSKNFYWQIEEGKNIMDQICQNQFAGTCLMRRDVFDALSGYDAGMCPPGHWVGLEDFDLFVGFLRWGWQYRVVPEPLLFARQNAEQASAMLYGGPKYYELIEKIALKHGQEIIWIKRDTFPYNLTVKGNYLQHPQIPLV